MQSLQGLPMYPSGVYWHRGLVTAHRTRTTHLQMRSHLSNYCPQMEQRWCLINTWAAHPSPAWGEGSGKFIQWAPTSPPPRPVWEHSFKTILKDGDQWESHLWQVCAGWSVGISTNISTRQHFGEGFDHAHSLHQQSNWSSSTHMAIIQQDGQKGRKTQIITFSDPLKVWSLLKSITNEEVLMGSWKMQ